MVDRYQSLIQSQQSSRKNRNSSILLQNNNRQLNQLIKRTQKSSASMKKYINQYRQATTSQQEKEIIQKFRQQQEKLHSARQLLTKEFKSMGNDKNGKEGGDKLLVKEHLLKTVQKELKLDVEMNQLISRKQNMLEVELKKLQPGSQKLQNALSDLTEKRDQIMYLKQQVKECVQLLQIIGVLVLENTQKIELALQDVKNANDQVNRTLKNIQLAKMRSEKSRKRKCCIIILGLIVIIVIIALLFGFGFIPI